MWRTATSSAWKLDVMQARCACSRCSRRKLEAVRARASDAEAVVIVVFSCGDCGEALDFAECFLCGCGVADESFRNGAIGAGEGDGTGVGGFDDDECAEASERCELRRGRDTGAEDGGAVGEKRLLDLGGEGGAVANVEQPCGCMFVFYLRGVVDDADHAGSGGGVVCRVD